MNSSHLPFTPQAGLSPKPSALSLEPGRLTQAQAAFQTHSAQVPAGTSRATLREPSFWRSVAGRLRPRDEIRVVDEGLTWAAVLLVRAVNINGAVVGEISYASLTEPAGSPTRGSYEAKWLDLYRQWAVVAAATGEVVKDGFASEADASAFVAMIGSNAPTQIGSE